MKLTKPHLKLIRAAKKALRELDWAMPGTPTHKIYDQLLDAIELSYGRRWDKKKERWVKL